MKRNEGETLPAYVERRLASRIRTNMRISKKALDHVQACGYELSSAQVRDLIALLERSQVRWQLIMNELQVLRANHDAVEWIDRHATQQEARR